MKLRLLCVAVLFVFAGAVQAAGAAEKDDAFDTGSKKLTIPSVELGGGSLGVSGMPPDDPNVPKFNDPSKQDAPLQPFIGLKFTKPLGGK